MRTTQTVRSSSKQPLARWRRVLRGIRPAQSVSTVVLSVTTAWHRGWLSAHSLVTPGESTVHGRGLGEPATSAPGQDQPESEGRTGLRINARSENAITAALTIAITDRMDESDDGHGRKRSLIACGDGILESHQQCQNNGSPRHQLHQTVSPAESYSTPVAVSRT